jgi:5-methylcytosine-specific restriction endonuclease McrA
MSKWQKENAEHLRAYQREYYKGKYAARNAKNSKRIKERFVFDDMDEIQKFYRNCPKGFHVDHIIPLNGKNVSGLHTMGNLQYLSATENLRKYNKYDVQ